MAAEAGVPGSAAGTDVGVGAGIGAGAAPGVADPAVRLPFPRRIPFVDVLGMELWGFGGGRAELRMDLDDEHHNSWSVAHGGVLMTLLDVAMAHAARSLDADGATPDPAATPGVVTIEMKTSFLRPAQGRLRAEGTLLHRTATMAFTEGSVFDADGRRCAHATGTFKFLRGLPTGGRRFNLLAGADGAAAPESPR